MECEGWIYWGNCEGHSGGNIKRGEKYSGLVSLRNAEERKKNEKAFGKKKRVRGGGYA